MPCVSDYQEPNGLEVEHARLNALLKEVKGGKFSKTNFENAFDSKVYNKTTKEIVDTKTAELCGILKKTNKDVISKYSLELQLWWRDHKKADARRKREKKADTNKVRLRKAALAKLSTKEREALNIG